MATITTPIYDTAVGSNENPLANASNGQTYANITDQGTVGLTSLQRTSNQIAGQGASNSYLNVSRANNCESGGTIATAGATNDVVDFLICLTSVTAVATITAYTAKITFPSTVTLNRVNSIGSTTVLNTFTQTVIANDGLAIQRWGSGLAALYRSGLTGTWTLLGTATDATFTAGGYGAITIIGTTAKLVNLFGGNLVSDVLVRRSIRNFSGLIVR